MRALARLLALSLAVCILAPRPASADTMFSFAFDDNGLTDPLNPSPPIVGTGSLTLAGDVGDGTYTLASLAGFSMSFSFSDGDAFTQADVVSDPTQSEVVVYNNGRDAYFSDLTPDLITGGSITLVNANNDILSFSPDYLTGFYFEVGSSSFLEGNYGPASVPEPASLTLMAAAGLVGLGVRSIRRRVRSS